MYLIELKSSSAVEIFDVNRLSLSLSFANSCILCHWALSQFLHWWVILRRISIKWQSAHGKKTNPGGAFDRLSSGKARAAFVNGDASSVQRVICSTAAYACVRSPLRRESTCNNRVSASTKKKRRGSFFYCSFWFSSFLRTIKAIKESIAGV